MLRVAYVEETGTQFRFPGRKALDLEITAARSKTLSRTTPCVACGHLVSYTAKSCPSCGHRQPATMAWERGAILTGILVMMFSAIVTQELLSIGTAIGVALIGVAVVAMNRR